MHNNDNQLNISYVHSNFLKAVPDHVKLVDIYLNDTGPIYNLNSKIVRYNRNINQSTHNTYILFDPNSSFSNLSDSKSDWSNVEYSIKASFLMT